MKQYAFLNSTGGTIPAGAVMVVTGEDANGILTVAQCTTANSLYVVFNGPADVPNGANGTAFPCAPDTLAAINTADLPYTYSDTFGTVSGDWNIRKGGHGFRVPTQPYNGLANAMPDPVGSAGATGIPIYTGLLLSGFSATTASFPSGYSLQTSINGHGLPSKTDFCKISFSSSVPTNSSGLVPVLILAHFNLFIDKLASGNASFGFFVVQANLGGGPWFDIGSVAYPNRSSASADLPSFVAGTAPLLALYGLDTIPPTTTVTVNYRVIFFSNPTWSGANPTVTLTVCSSGFSMINTDYYENIAVGDPHLWYSGAYRPSSGTGSCPTASTTSAAS